MHLYYWIDEEGCKLWVLLQGPSLLLDLVQGCIFSLRSELPSQVHSGSKIWALEEIYGLSAGLVNGTLNPRPVRIGIDPI